MAAQRRLEQREGAGREHAWRAADTGGGSLDSFSCPLIQDQLDRALDLTAVHVDRILRALTDAGLIRFARGQGIVRDAVGLRRPGEFRPPRG